MRYFVVAAVSDAVVVCRIFIFKFIVKIFFAFFFTSFVFDLVVQQQQQQRQRKITHKQNIRSHKKCSPSPIVSHKRAIFDKAISQILCRFCSFPYKRIRLESGNEQSRMMRNEL